MEFNYDAFKQTFVDYFSNKGYKTLVSNRDKNLIFMYSLKDDISVIELTNSVNQSNMANNDLNRLLKKIAKIKETNIGDLKVVKLCFDEAGISHTELDDNRFTIVANNMDFFKTKLKGKFTDIVNVDPITNTAKFKEITTSKKLTKEEADDLSQVENQDQLQQKVNQLQLNIKQNRGFAPMFYMVAFLVVPLIAAVVSFTSGILDHGFGLEVSRLFQGGTTFNLAIAGREWWRIFTWGLSTPSDNFIISIIVILVAGWSAFNMMKLSEFNMKPWKFLLGFFAAYVMTGFFTSVLFDKFVVGGVMPILGIATGMLALGTSAKKTLVAAVSKLKLVWPIILMVIFPIFTGGGYEYAAEIMGFAIGGAIAYLIAYNYKETNWTLSLPIIILVIAIALPVAWIIVYETSMPTTAPDNNVILTLRIYISKHWMSLDHANNIIENIGWDIPKMKQTDSGITYIPYMN